MLGRLPMHVEADAKALGLLVKHGADPAMGARPLRRAIDDLVGRAPLERAAQGDASARTTRVRLGVKGGKLTFDRPSRRTAEATR